MGGKILKGRGRPDTDGLDAQSATNWIRTYGEVWSIRSAEFRIREKIAALTSGEVTTEDREAVETRLSSDKMLLARLIEDASGETGLYWEIPSNLVQMLSEDPSKLWENATLDQFRENGKYNQMSLSDDGTLFLTIIKPGAVESIKLAIWEELEDAIRTRFVREIRDYIAENRFKWSSEWERYRHEYDGLGGIYSFHRIGILLDSDEYCIIISWVGQHGEPVTEWGPFSIDGAVEIQIQQK
jgi:hypothetical protein